MFQVDAIGIYNMFQALHLKRNKAEDIQTGSNGV